MIEYFRENHELQAENAALREKVAFLEAFDEKYQAFLEQLERQTQEQMRQMQGQQDGINEQLRVYEQRFAEMEETIKSLLLSQQRQGEEIEAQKGVIERQGREIETKNKFILDHLSKQLCEPKEEREVRRLYKYKSQLRKLKRQVQKQKTRQEYLEGLVLGKGAQTSLEKFYRLKYFEMQEKYQSLLESSK